jgi:hypothetical protein
VLSEHAFVNDHDIAMRGLCGIMACLTLAIADKPDLALCRCYARWRLAARLCCVLAK